MASTFLTANSTPVDPLYPTGAGMNQDEYMLIEYKGILHSETEEILYGLIDCEVINMYPFRKYRELMKELGNQPDQLYSETAFYQTDELITYLNDGEKLPPDAMAYIKRYCKVNYTFTPSVKLAFTVAMRRLISESYIKGVTIVFDSPEIAKDVHYLNDMLGEKYLQQKGKIVYLDPENHPEIEDIPSLMAAEILEANRAKKPYTTIVTNHIDLVEDCLISCEQVGLETAFFLLRNHSGNMKPVTLNTKEEVQYEEVGTKTIEDIINPNKYRTNEHGFHLPLLAKFARFSPILY